MSFFVYVFLPFRDIKKYKETLAAKSVNQKATVKNQQELPEVPVG